MFIANAIIKGVTDFLHTVETGDQAVSAVRVTQVCRKHTAVATGAIAWHECLYKTHWFSLVEFLRRVRYPRQHFVERGS